MNASDMPMLLQTLATCVCTALREDGAGDMCWCGSMVASDTAVSWDLCGECSGNKCGTGFVTLTGLFPYEQFPFPLAYSKCDAFFMAELVVGALRCSPTIDPVTKDLPSEREVFDASADATADMFALLKALQCCSLPAEVFVRQWQALGPSGGCQGGQWRVVVADTEGEPWPVS